MNHFPPFQLCCPRCESLNFEVTLLKAGDVFRATSGSVFSCHDCEKQLFGDAVQSAYDRQLAKHLALYREWKRAQELVPVPVPVPESVPESVPAPSLQCAWHECSNAARENSKYCSRQCSNKNARYRAKMREQEGT